MSPQQEALVMALMSAAQGAQPQAAGRLPGLAMSPGMLGMPYSAMLGQAQGQHQNMAPPIMAAVNQMRGLPPGGQQGQ